MNFENSQHSKIALFNK